MSSSSSSSTPPVNALASRGDSSSDLLKTANFPSSSSSSSSSASGYSNTVSNISTSSLGSGGSSGSLESPITESTLSMRKDHRVLVRIIEAKFEPKIDYENVNGLVRIDDHVDTQIRTRTMWKSKTPFWDEEYEFELNNSFREINVELWNKNKFTKDTLIGYVRLLKPEMDLDNRHHESWYPLYKKNEDESDEQAKEKIGSIRLKYKYTEEFILPLPTYGKILEIFYDEKLEVVTAYGKITDEREDAAKTMLRIADYCDVAVNFLGRLCAVEVQNCSDVNTIFRANSLASKAVDYYMKLIAKPYLSSVLQPIIDEIVKQDRSCEVDPSRLEKGEDVEQNFAIIIAYIEWAFNRIFDTVLLCPPPLREVFSSLQASVAEKFVDDKVAKYTSVSGFIFLRFFNAAILGPKLFGLLSEHPNQRTSRTLTITSKVLQNLANLISFDGAKEPYMTIFNPFIQKNLERMKNFIDKIATKLTEAEAEAASSKPVGRPRKNTFVDKTTNLKKKDKSSSKLARQSSFLKSTVAPDVIIDRELAALHRLFIRGRAELEKLNETEKNDKVAHLSKVLDSMQQVYEMRKLEMEAERERQRKLRMAEDELSLEDMLNGATTSTPNLPVITQAIAKAKGPDLHLNPNRKITSKDAFDLLKSEDSVSMRDLEHILGSQGLEMDHPAVQQAVQAHAKDKDRLNEDTFLNVMNELRETLQSQSLLRDLQKYLDAIAPFIGFGKGEGAPPYTMTVADVMRFSSMTTKHLDEAVREAWLESVNRQPFDLQRFVDPDKEIEMALPPLINAQQDAKANSLIEHANSLKPEIEKLKAQLAS